MTTHTNPAARAIAQGRVTALLGPTNTGKTHFAIERMLAHKSGMIGLPLRLLAREVYERVARLKGAHSVSLITGEEKILPPNARWHICTVEAMPLDIPVACLVVDEIQLCADAERGHVFTERLLHARGEEETIFLGADTMKNAIARFIPQAWFTSRPRLSDLAYTGAKKLTRLPRRSAVVGFSVEDVYGIADIIRRQRGGAAVVLGALSPRTRNAQVELYQNGDVDFLVATDAIGMGLNMDVDHVAFAARDKFDGAGMRALRPDEIGQIAGRAGRHMNDGTFGVTFDCEPFEEEIVSRVEGHRYDPVRALKWRNGDLDMRSLDALIESLDVPPPMKGLMRGRIASDMAALRALASDGEIRAMAGNRDALKLLWQVCQLPDFRKLSSEEHARQVRGFFVHLAGPEGAIPADLFARQIVRLDVTEGDVATLSGRLAQIRTYTYVAHRPGWLADAGHWQGETRAIEDRLSDALHERLTQRFVDRRTAVLMKHLREDDTTPLALDEDGGVSVHGETVGKLEGFRFAPDPRAKGLEGRALRAAALKGLESEIETRARRLAVAEDGAITLSEHGRFWWEGAIVGKLAAGPAPLSPRAQVIADEHLRADARTRIEARLNAWMAARVESRLAPLASLARAVEIEAGNDGALPGPARGIAHQLVEHFGVLDRAQVVLPQSLGALIATLKGHGVWFGRRSVYLPKLLRPEAASLLALLSAVHRNGATGSAPMPGLTSFIEDAGLDDAFLAASGFRKVGPRAVRIDIIERVDELLEKESAGGEELALKLVSLLGSDREAMLGVANALGWGLAEGTWSRFDIRKREKPRKPDARPNGNRKNARGKRHAEAPLTFDTVTVRPDSPFAGLAALVRK